MRALPALMAILCGTLAWACGPAAPEAPRPAPAVKLQLLQAPQAALEGWEGLRGKLVVLEFWATWCEDCVAAQPHLNELAEEFAGRPVQFLSVTDEPERDVRRFLKTHELRGWIGLDPDGAAFAAFGVRGVPQTVLLDGAGNVLGETYPDLLSAERLEALLSAQKRPAR